MILPRRIAATLEIKTGLVDYVKISEELRDGFTFLRDNLHIVTLTVMLLCDNVKRNVCDFATFSLEGKFMMRYCNSFTLSRDIFAVFEVNCT